MGTLRGRQASYVPKSPGQCSRSLANRAQRVQGVLPTIPDVRVHFTDHRRALCPLFACHSDVSVSVLAAGATDRAHHSGDRQMSRTAGARSGTYRGATVHRVTAATEQEVLNRTPATAARGRGGLASGRGGGRGGGRDGGRSSASLLGQSRGPGGGGQGVARDNRADVQRQRFIRVDDTQRRRLRKRFDEFDNPSTRLEACKTQQANGGAPVLDALQLSPCASRACDQSECRCRMSYHGLACDLAIQGGAKTVTRETAAAPSADPPLTPLVACVLLVCAGRAGARPVRGAQQEAHF